MTSHQHMKAGWKAGSAGGGDVLATRAAAISCTSRPEAHALIEFARSLGVRAVPRAYDPRIDHRAHAVVLDLTYAGEQWFAIAVTATRERLRGVRHPRAHDEVVTVLKLLFASVLSHEALAASYALSGSWPTRQLIDEALFALIVRARRLGHPPCFALRRIP